MEAIIIKKQHFEDYLTILVRDLTKRLEDEYELTKNSNILFKPSKLVAYHVYTFRDKIRES